MESEKCTRSSSSIICPLCSIEYSPEGYNAHLSKHSQAEVELLKKFNERTRKMSLTEIRALVSHWDIESYKLVQSEQ